nr:myelin-associated oligodendrocyte basic protein [Tanacetum cinerariifolium]
GDPEAIEMRLANAPCAPRCCKGLAKAQSVTFTPRNKSRLELKAWREMRSEKTRSESSYGSNSRSRVHPTPPIGSADIFLFMSFLAIFLMCCYLYHRRGDHGEDTSFKTSVFKLQVGLLGTARSLQKDLNEIAKTTNTSTSDGFRHILKATIGALLEHPDYYTSGYSCVENGSSVKEAEKQFQKLSFDERSKFDEETLVNLNNVIKQSATSQKSNEYTVVDMGSKFDEEPLVNVENVRKRNATSQMFQGVSCNEYIVVTIIVAACGLHKLPPVKSNAELKKALQTLASVPSSKIMAAVVLWTPQKKDDTLSEQELDKNYPLLYPL